MNRHDDTGHLSAERLQELLEGELRGTLRRDAEEHLAVCRRCSSELEAWETMFEELGTLPTYAPHEGFAARVMAGVEVPERLSLPRRLAARLSPAREAHADDATLEAFTEGALSGRKAARVSAHLDACPSCAKEAVRWRGVFGALGTLPRFSPDAGFADAVMERVRVPEPTPVRRHAWPAVTLALSAAARRLVPRTRRAWAALSGAAVTPAVTVALVAWVVFSHPTLTPGALASFLWWQLVDVAGAAWGGFASAALEGIRGSGLYGTFDTLASSPLVVAGLLAAYAALSFFAVRVLYRNLRSHSSLHGHHA